MIEPVVVAEPVLMGVIQLYLYSKFAQTILLTFLSEWHDTILRAVSTF